MLEQDVIQTRGFHNLVENGIITGFQICVRSDYYRGIWLSQLRVGKLVVDGISYPEEMIRWEVNGKEYTIAEMKHESKVFWNILDVAKIKVKKAGGLSQGFHTVVVRFAASCSYMPPTLDRFDREDDDVSFNGGTYVKDKMIIV
ncbi:C-glycoside deglycosidase beta subunit domain-containing protein [Ligilactobacillus agilis]|uniref:C-glycoside deglycosidase beta subunit domain-containing protein n=1 Tax=Ligilactobacillus agilis TaxID=1601 RepID=UPI00255D03BC|nr:DUF6379 domain-containing protein [Ligilactobacillus agilis]